MIVHRLKFGILVAVATSALALGTVGLATAGPSEGKHHNSEGKHHKPERCKPTRKCVISTSKAPAAIGPYSQAVKVGDSLYVSGQISIDPTTNELVGETVAEQGVQVMDNLAAVLKAAGMSMDDVVQATAYVTDIDQFAAFNGVYGSYFTDGMPPARGTVEVSALPKGALVEVALVAVQ